MRATVFRPIDEPADGNVQRDIVQRPLAVINHGTDEATHEAVSMPVFYWLSKWFVDRGYVVLLPQRRGHGSTGGELAEARDSCRDPNHYRAGQTAADDIEAALGYMQRQPFIAPGETVVAGVSSGGWASLALAARNPPHVRAIINVAGGRGARKGGRANAICDEKRLIQSAGAYGRDARVPTLWLYARNDTYFGPDLATAMAGAWSASGAIAELHVLPPYGLEGHGMMDDRAGWRYWGPHVESFLARHAVTPASSIETSSLPDKP